MTDKQIAGHTKSALSQRMVDSVVLDSFRQVHGSTYDYSKMQYVNNKTKIEIMCKEHGVFWQTPGDHKRGTKCPQCSNRIMAASKLKPLLEVMQNFNAVHGDTYDYTQVFYVNAWTPIQIICSTHGIFEQAPEHHRRGSGCPSCTAQGFNPLKPAKLYYVKVTTTNGPLYKIGITNRTVEERFGADMPLITVLKVWDYEVGAEAYQVEQTILKLNQEHRYTGEPVLRCGNTELFTIDVGDYDGY